VTVVDSFNGDQKEEQSQKSETKENDCEAFKRNPREKEDEVQPPEASGEKEASQEKVTRSRASKNEHFRDAIRISAG
jgi:hypothetical protein